MKILIGFSRAKSLFAIGSEIIRLADNRDYSHVYIRCNDIETGLDMIYQASHGYVNSITYNNFKIDNLIIKEYILDVPLLHYVDMMKYVKMSLGTPYGYIQLLMIGIKKLCGIKINTRNGTDKEICSEFGARIAQLDGINVGKDLDFTAPSDLDMILHVNKIPCLVPK